MKKLYTVEFYRFNSRVEPMMEQRTHVVFRTDIEMDEGKDFRSCLSIDDVNEVKDIMWEEMWKQNPAWLLSHGPSTINFAGWSSVMTKFDSIKKVTINEKPMPEDLTGEGNMLVALTYHPLLPSDMRTALRKAFERGVAYTNKEQP